MSHTHTTLAAIQNQLDAFKSGAMPLRDFVAQARPMAAPVLAQLPPAFETVWHNLLDRIESSALFAEESCSFSQTDLTDSLQMWLDKAQSRLV